MNQSDLPRLSALETFVQPVQLFFHPQLAVKFETRDLLRI
jgi:hypothetical protein